MTEQISDLELEVLELLSMSGETVELLIEMLNYEDEHTPESERKIVEPEVRSVLDRLLIRGFVTSELGYSPNRNTDELERVLWWDITAKGLAVVEALESSGERDFSLPRMETRRLLLRQWRDEDLDPYARICADPETMRYMSASGSPRTSGQTSEIVSSIRQHWIDHHFGLWAVEEMRSGKFIGRIGLQYHKDWPGEHKVEVGWLLDKACWGDGLATEGAQASLAYGFENRKLERIISVALPENRASRRVMEKCGLTFLGETHWRDTDVVWYAIDRKDWRAGRLTG